MLKRVEPAGFVGRVQRRREEAGRDEHEHDAGDPEELAEVEMHAAAVDRVSEDHGEQHAERGAGTR